MKWCGCGSKWAVCKRARETSDARCTLMCFSFKLLPTCTSTPGSISFPPHDFLTVTQRKRLNVLILWGITLTEKQNKTAVFSCAGLGRQRRNCISVPSNELVISVPRFKIVFMITPSELKAQLCPLAPAVWWESILSDKSGGAAGLDTGSGTSCAMSFALVVGVSTVLTNRLGFEHAVTQSRCFCLCLLTWKCVCKEWRFGGNSLTFSDRASL